MKAPRGSTVLALLLLGVALHQAHGQDATYGADLGSAPLINPIEQVNTDPVTGADAPITSEIDVTADAPVAGDPVFDLLPTEVPPSSSSDVPPVDVAVTSSVVVEGSTTAVAGYCQSVGMPDAAASATDNTYIVWPTNELFAGTDMSTVMKTNPAEAKKCCADMMFTTPVKPLESMAPGETQVTQTALPGSSCTIYKRQCTGVAGCTPGYDLKWSNGNTMQFEDSDYYERSSGARNAKVYVVRKSAKSKMVAKAPAYKSSYTDLASACRANGATVFANMLVNVTSVIGADPAGTLYVPTDDAMKSWQKPAKWDSDDYHKEVIGHHYSPDTSCTTPRVPNDGHDMLSVQRWPLRFARSMSGYTVSCYSGNNTRTTATVVKPDILVKKLVIHFVDKVLTPPVEPPAPAPPVACKADIADVLIDQQKNLYSKGYNVTTFPKLLKTYSRNLGGLYLNGPCTVFVPTDDAVNSYLTHKGIKGLSALTADQAVELLKHHIVPKSKILKQHIFSDQYLTTGKNRTVRCTSSSSNDVAVVSDNSISNVKVYDISACKAVAHVIDYPLTYASYKDDGDKPKRPFPGNRPCLVNTLVKRPDMHNGIKLLNAGGLDMQKLSNPELTCTFLVPSSSVNLKSILDKLPGGAGNAHYVSRLHIIPGVGRTVKNMTDEGTTYSIGDDKEVSCDGSQVKSEGSYAKFTKDVDIDVGNGLTKVHVIDNCLVPTIQNDTYSDIGQALDKNPNLSFLKDLLNVTGMRSQLSGKALSLYAPSNKAFKKLGQQLCGCDKGMSVQEFAALPEIKDILSGHLSTSTEQFKVLSGYSGNGNGNGNGNGRGRGRGRGRSFKISQYIPGLIGRNFTLKVAQESRGGYKLVKGMGQSVARITKTDVKCGQAVVQVVDTVIKPDSLVKRMNKSEDYMCDAEIEYLNKFGAVPISCGAAYEALYGKGPGSTAYVRLPCEGSKCFYAKVQLTSSGQTYSAVKVYTGALRMYGSGGNFQAIRYYAGGIGARPSGLDLYAGGLNAILALRWYGAGTIGTGNSARIRIYIPPAAIAPTTSAIRYYSLSIGVTQSIWLGFDASGSGEGVTAAVRVPIDNTGRR